MTGLVGWWPLNEDSGSTAYDLSGNGNHGSLNGGIVQGVAGKGGLTSYSFDGSDDYVDSNFTVDFSNGESFSIGLWAKSTDSTQDKQTLVSAIETTNYNNIYLSYHDGGSGGGPRVVINDGSSSTDIQLSTDYRDNNWHHIYVTYNGATSHTKLYVDGELAGNSSATLSGINVGYNAFIGVQNQDGAPNSTYFNGSISEVRMYNRVLSPEEIQELYHWGNGDYARPLNDQNSSSAVSRWAFDGDLTDSWGNNDGASNVGAGYDSGIRNQAKIFDGADEYVSISNTGVTSPVTVSSWIYPRSSGGNGYGRIFDQQDDFDLALGDSSGYTLLWEINNNNYWYGNDTLPKNEWHHVVASIDSSGVGKVYVNGSLLDKKNSETVNSSNNTAKIGDMVSGGRKFDGFIDDVRIYNKALSPSEVFELNRWGTRGRDMRKLTVNSR